MRRELKDDASSLYSFTSEASCDDVPESSRVKELPSFLLRDDNSIETGRLFLSLECYENES